MVYIMDAITTSESNLVNYRIWYKNLNVLYEMMRCVYNREVVVINPFKKSEAIRCIRVNNAQQWEGIFKWINFDRRTWNFYYSLAKYKEGIPYQTFNMEERDNTAWNKEHWKHIEAFDMLIDLDCDSHDSVSLCKNDVKAISDFLTIPHSVRYSGMGYHIIIPGEFMPKLSFNPDDQDNYFDFMYDCLIALKRKFSDFVDTGCHDPRRVVKIPYSLALYEDDNYVCYPLRTLRELSLEPLNYLSSAVINDLEPIRQRGIPLIKEEQVVSFDCFKKLLGNKWKKYGIKD